MPNDHNLPSSTEEQRARDADAHDPWITRGGVPDVPVSSLTLPAWATSAYVLGGVESIFVEQPAVSVVLADVAGMHWIALHASTVDAVAGWTRPTFGSHYLLQVSATRPVDPAGGLVIGAATVAASIITTVGGYGTRRVTTTQTIPYDQQWNDPVHIQPAGLLDVDAGITLTINGVLTAPPQQIFTGSGVVEFGPGATTELYIEWWGGKADNSTDNTAAFAAVIANMIARPAHLQLLEGTYLTGPIDFTNLTDCSVFGKGYRSTVILANVGGTNFMTFGTAIAVPFRVWRCRFGGFRIEGDIHTYTNAGLRLNMQESYFSNLYISGFDTQVSIEAGAINTWDEVHQSQFSTNGTVFITNASGVNVWRMRNGTVLGPNPEGASTGFSLHGVKACFIEGYVFERLDIGVRARLGNSINVHASYFEDCNRGIQTGDTSSEGVGSAMNIIGSFFTRCELFAIDWDTVNKFRVINVQGCFFLEDSALGVPSGNTARIGAVQGVWEGNDIKDNAGGTLKGVIAADTLTRLRYEDEGTEWFGLGVVGVRQTTYVDPMPTGTPGANLLRLPKNGVGFVIQATQRLSASDTAVSTDFVTIDSAGVLTRSNISTVGAPMGIVYEVTAPSPIILRAFSTNTAQMNFIIQGTFDTPVTQAFMPQGVF